MSDDRRPPIPSEPPVDRRAFMWQQHEALIDQPGVWFLIGDYPSYKTAQSLVSELRNGKREVPPGRWEYRHGQLPPDLRQTDSRPFGIWARYLGPADTLEESQ